MKLSVSEAHTQRAHARLAPSSAYRWIACPGSVRMSEGIADVTSSYAAEGTAAHELAAWCLTWGHDAVEFLGSVIDTTDGTIRNRVPDSALNADGITRFEVDEEMVESVQLYIDTVQDLIPNGEYELDIEQRLDMTHIHPEIFGTGDVVLYDIGAAWLHVPDFKYGKGVVVSPTENPQLMLYGAGAVRRYHNRPLLGITLYIVQPRAGGAPVRSWSTDPLLLMEFEDDLKKAALETEHAANSYESMTGAGNGHIWQQAWLKAGDHCRFCKAAPVCPALREKAFASALAEFEPEERVAVIPPSMMSPKQFAAVLRDAEVLGNWIKAVQEYAHAEAMAGRTPPGFKLVAKRAVRKWRDEDRAYRAIADTGNEPYMDPKMKSPAMFEKDIGKARFAEFFADNVQQVSSGTNLVPISDPRPAVSVGAVNEFTEG